MHSPEEEPPATPHSSRAYSEHRYHMLRQHHAQTLWTYWVLILLGVWTLFAPFSFGYMNPGQWVEPGGGRGPWFANEPHAGLRAWLMTISDIVAGLLLIVLGWRSLQPNRPRSIWTACLVGVWLTAAPLLFWAPTPTAYFNGSLIGMLVVTFTVLIPGLPNMILYMRMGDATPPGWSYNPSSWPQRAIIIALGFAGFLVTRYLGMYQLGYIDRVWDPFFGAGTRATLDARMPHAWPIAHGALSALAYQYVFLMGWMGSPARWRTIPWIVTLFGLVILSLGLVHVALVLSQPVVAGEWCTFCLVAAAIMLPMIPLGVDEVVAMIQHLQRARARGENVWQVFWKGGSAEGCTDADEAPAMSEFPVRPKSVWRASIWGMSFPLTLTLSTALGVCTVLMPAVFAMDASLANVLHVSGALLVVISAIAISEVLRMGRLLNIPLGLAVALAPWLSAGTGLDARLTGTLLGLATILLTVPRGPKTQHYGAWDRWVR